MTPEEATAILAALVDEGVEFAVIGSMAMTAQGLPRATQALERKGVIGDWRNGFSREAAERFDELAGDALVRLGHEDDRGWVDRYDYPVP